jgi:hypothetical protein
MIECLADNDLPFSRNGPYVSVRDKALAACNSAILLEKEGYSGREETADELRKEISIQLNEEAAGRQSKIADIATTPAGAIFVQTILSKFDEAVVREAQQLRTYITNRLIVESDSLDPKVRLKALELLGKITEVGLFTERSEVTINQKSTEDLSEALKAKLRKLMNRGGDTSVEDAVIIQNPTKLENKIKAIDI